MDLKRFISSAALTAVAGAAMLFASADVRADTLDGIRERGSMIVAVDPTFAPFEYTDADGEITGYDPDLLRLVADRMGVEIEWRQMSFTGIIPGLVSGSFDFTATALAVTAERAERVGFTVPVAEGVSAVLRRTGDDRIADAEPETLAGLSAAVKTTTQPEQVMQAFNDELEADGLEPVNLLSVETVEQTISALMAERVDFVVDDLAVLATVIRERPEGIEIVEKIGPSVYISWGTRKEDEALRAALDEEIMALAESGELADLQREYFGVTFDLPTDDFVPAE
ncbi:MAG: transporter substrate-binding domain-containing protein [Azospirillaceae bacterium]